MTITSESYFPRGETVENTHYTLLQITTENNVETLRQYYTYEIDDGDYLVRDEIINVDGIVKTTEYRNWFDRGEHEMINTRQLVRIEDSADNIKSWDSIEMRFDIDGVMDLKTTIFDNGRVRKAVYEDGEIQFARTEDVGDIYSWQEKIEYFDGDGNLSELATVFDDGRVVADTYEGDQIVDTIIFASEDDWSDGRIPADEIIRTKTVLDDGAAVVVLQDAPTNLKDWETVEIKYDASGTITERTVSYDDYLINTETHDNGRLTFEVVEDKDDKYDFRYREITYDENGEIAVFYQKYDFTDAYRKFYEDGVLTKIEKHGQMFDIPSSREFSEEVIFFDLDGNKEYRVGEFGFEGMRYFKYDDDGDVLTFASSDNYRLGDDYGIINHYDSDGDVISHEAYRTQEQFDAALAGSFAEAPSDFFAEVDTYAW